MDVKMRIKIKLNYLKTLPKAELLPKSSYYQCSNSTEKKKKTKNTRNAYESLRQPLLLKKIFLMA